MVQVLGDAEVGWDANHVRLPPTTACGHARHARSIGPALSRNLREGCVEFETESVTCVS